MQREARSAEPPASPEVLKLVEAMLGEAPIDPGMLTPLADPAAAEARAKAATALREADWANLGRYQDANARLLAAGERPKVVFMGDSITEAWPMADPALFGPGRVCRGVAGQTSPQMLVRFWPDVVALAPAAVHILCGVNDIAGNTGPTTPARFQANVMAMVELAAARAVRVIMGAITPAGRMLWRPDIDPKPWIAELNGWLGRLAAERGFAFADYHAPLDDGAGALRREYSHDGVHPNRRGYAVMRAVLEPLL